MFGQISSLDFGVSCTSMRIWIVLGRCLFLQMRVGQSCMGGELLQRDRYRSLGLDGSILGVLCCRLALLNCSMCGVEWLGIM